MIDVRVKQRQFIRDSLDEIKRLRRLLKEVGDLAASRAVRVELLESENARLHEAVKMARECLEDRDVIGANLTLEKAIGEKE
jgi:hypothetical protein